MQAHRPFLACFAFFHKMKKIFLSKYTVPFKCVKLGIRKLGNYFVS